MKIRTGTTEETRFGELEPGTVFRAMEGKRLLMKAVMYSTQGGTTTVTRNAVYLHSGGMESYSPDARVVIVPGEFVVGGV